MLAEELARIIQQGMTPVVRFNWGTVLEHTCFDQGMCGRIVSCIDNNSKKSRAYKFEISLSEFEEFNRCFEARKHKDKFGIARLTAREASSYSVIDTVWVDEGTHVPWAIEDASRLRLIALYEKEKPNMNYMEWLEKFIIHSPLIANQSTGA